MTHSETDKNGRYVMVTGKLYDAPIILANIYAPNSEDESYLNLILIGDFNLVMDPILDRSSKNINLCLDQLKSCNSFWKPLI